MIAASLAVGVGLVAWWLFPEDSPSPAPLPPGALPYATQGFEEVNILGGARHVYPATTGIAVRRTDCGRRIVWQPLRDRVTAYDLCHGRLRSIGEVHEFFGSRDERTYRCSRRSSLRRGWRCTSGETTDVAVGGVVGVERVDGEEAVHVRLKTRISGGTEGTGTQDFWFRRPDGLLVRLAATNENSTPSPVGNVEYRERYRLTLRAD